MFDVSWYIIYIINPRRACAARVTVVVSCVCVSVCMSVRTRYSRTRIYPRSAARRGAIRARLSVHKSSPNSAEGLHFSAFSLYILYSV